MSRVEKVTKRARAVVGNGVGRLKGKNASKQTPRFPSKKAGFAVLAGVLAVVGVFAFKKRGAADNDAPVGAGQNGTDTVNLPGDDTTDATSTS